MPFPVRESPISPVATGVLNPPKVTQTRLPDKKLSRAERAMQDFICGQATYQTKENPKILIK
jgi:hypothetical protein